MRPDDPPAFIHAHPAVALTTDRTLPLAAKQCVRGSEVATEGRDDRVAENALKPDGRSRLPKCRDGVVAVEVLRSSKADSERTAPEQLVENSQIVRDQRLLISMECLGYLGHDVRKINLVHRRSSLT